MMRQLSNKFTESLKTGILAPLLICVKMDDTLCLEIRKDYINIYYRGGNILRVEQSTDLFKAHFDTRYILNNEVSRVPENLPLKIRNKDDINSWIQAFPFLKNEMDLWFSKHPKDEREYQQLIIRENNLRKMAKSTDYFICDIEYVNSHCRFDLIAVHWPSSGAQRKKNIHLGLAFIEMKYYDAALKGSAGITKHLEDMNTFLLNKENLQDIKDEMRMIFNQKKDLGLINNQNAIAQFSDSKPEYIFIFANHDPDSTLLIKELNKLPELLKKLNFEERANLKFAVSNFMGYGLYKENIYSLIEFNERFAKQIYSKSNS